jgi:hypothetical protein
MIAQSVNPMVESNSEPIEGKRPSAMDELSRLLMGLGCIVLIVVPLLVVAICIYVYFWGVKMMF